MYEIRGGQTGREAGENFPAAAETGEVETVAKNIRLTRAYRELKSSMEESMKARGITAAVFRDQLSRYLDLWCEYQELSDDIAERGVVVMDEKRGMLVENRSLTIRHQTSNKMLDIYTALGFRDISAPRSGPKQDVEDDEL